MGYLDNVLIGYFVKLLNFSSLRVVGGAGLTKWAGLAGLAGAGRKFRKLEVLSRGRAEAADRFVSGRARRRTVRFVAGRPTVMVFSTFIATIVTGDPGHPLSRVQNI